jgi:hypothetical protein
MVCVVIAACTSAPHHPATPVASPAPGGVARAADQAPVESSGAAPAQSGASLTSTAGAPVAGAAAMSGSGSARADDNLLRKGYRAVNYRGELVYCRVESPTGSRFSRKVCLTREQIRAREENAKDVLGTVRSDTSCVMIGCN